jgi:hypothetical protein
VEEENFGTFDTEKVVDFIEKYTTQYKGKYLFEEVLTRKTGIRPGQALHILCGLRELGVMTEEFRLICHHCYHPDNNAVSGSNEEIRELLKSYECNNCESKGAYIQLMYRFKEEE